MNTLRIPEIWQASKFRILGALLVFAGTTLLASAQTAADDPMIRQAQRDAIGVRMRPAMQLEMEAESIPSLSAAIFDDRGLIWSGAVGHSDGEKAREAAPDGLYRFGSVTKLLTAVAIMQMVEDGSIELDAPVKRYLKDFAPHNPFGSRITVRHLLTHRAGLVREPPTGSYFEIGDPGLKAVVASLNTTTLVAKPGTATKYSNAGFAVLGSIAETVSGTPLDALIRTRVLDRAGMDSSRLSVSGTRALVFAETGDYDAPRREAPQFDMGLMPGAGLVSSVEDVAAFGTALLAAGVSPDQARSENTSAPMLLKQSTLAEMMRVQYPKRSGERVFGLGFGSRAIGGRDIFGHGGAVYGYTTEFRIIPEKRIGIVIAGALDNGGAPARLADQVLRIADEVLEGGDPAPRAASVSLVPPTLARAVDGYYKAGKETVILREIDGLLYAELPDASRELIIRAGRLAFRDDEEPVSRIEIDPAGRFLDYGSQRFERTEWLEPALPEKSLLGLIGEYGWDHNFIRIFERNGQAYAQIETIDYVPLTRVTENRWAFKGKATLYPGEFIDFERASSGDGTSISLNGITFPRRRDGDPPLPADRTELLAKRDRLREAALLATPPAEPGKRTPDLVSLSRIDPSLIIDVRYAGFNNFAGVPFYSKPVAMMQRPAAEGLARANQQLRARGYGIIVYDAYRPWYVTKMFWDAATPEGRLYVADPSKGSRHNRGSAVDLSIVRLATGEVADMPGAYDESTPRSHPTFPGGSTHQRWLREILRQAMRAGDFSVFPLEWWHFDHVDWTQYPLGNEELSDE